MYCFWQFCLIICVSLYSVYGVLDFCECLSFYEVCGVTEPCMYCIDVATRHEGLGDRAEGPVAVMNFLCIPVFFPPLCLVGGYDGVWLVCSVTAAHCESN